MCPWIRGTSDPKTACVPNHIPPKSMQKSQHNQDWYEHGHDRLTGDQA
jgi:hypothetical protein